MGNVILTGFMGSGKSSVAIKLSYRLKKSVVDTDRWIEKKQGKSITEIFKQDVEDAFRQMETDALRSIKQNAKNDIISVGGGTPMREENRILMKEMGTVVYLRVTPQTVYERVKEDGSRPLLQCEDPQGRIRELLEKRGPLYEAAADVIIDVDGKTFGQILFEIERALRSREQEARGSQRPDGYIKDGQNSYGRKYDGQRRFSEQRSYGSYHGFNGFRRFGDTDAQNGTDTQADSQHAQNIQYALGERTQRQGSWQRRPYQGYGTKAEEAVLEAPAAEETAAEALSIEKASVEIPAAKEAVAETPATEAPAAEEKTAEKKRLTKLLVINGPNLNFLGIREKGIYGSQDYNYLLNLIAEKGIECSAAIEVYQSNHEGAIIDRIQASYFDGTEGIVINPGAYTHYSYAIRDALASIVVPKVEVHISNIMEREEFRHVSVTAPVCDKQIYGQGLNGYLQAIDFILDFKKNS